MCCHQCNQALPEPKHITVTDGQHDYCDKWCLKLKQEEEDEKKKQASQ
jgi:hypothetical protein